MCFCGIFRLAFRFDAVRMLVRTDCTLRLDDAFRQYGSYAVETAFISKLDAGLLVISRSSASSGCNLRLLFSFENRFHHAPQPSLICNPWLSNTSLLCIRGTRSSPAHILNSSYTISVHVIESYNTVGSPVCKDHFPVKRSSDSPHYTRRKGMSLCATQLHLHARVPNLPPQEQSQRKLSRLSWTQKHALTIRFAIPNSDQKRLTLHLLISSHFTRILSTA